VLSKDFCTHLEYTITAILKFEPREGATGFWCDGVIPNEPFGYYSITSTNKYQQFVFKGFIGHDGQTEYTITMKLGSKALSRYVRTIDITDCINTNCSLEINPDNKTLILYTD